MFFPHCKELQERPTHLLHLCPLCSWVTVKSDYYAWSISINKTGFMECKCELITQFKVIKFSINADGDLQVYLRNSFNRFWNTLNNKRLNKSVLLSPQWERMEFKLWLEIRWVFFSEEHKVLTGREEKCWSRNGECSVIPFYSGTLTLILPYFMLYNVRDRFVSCDKDMF